MRFLVFGVSPNYGGTEAVVFPMIERLLKNHVYFDFVNTFSAPLAQEDWLRSLGCRILTLNLRKRGGYFKYKNRLFTFFKQHQNEFDGAWFNIQEPDCSDLVRLAKRYNLSRILVVAHNAGSPSKSDFLRKMSVRLSKWRLRKLTIIRVAVSQLAGEITFGDKSFFRVIHSGIDIAKFLFSVEKRLFVRSGLNISANTRLYLFAGRLEEQKNPMFALDVFKALLVKDTKAHCLFVGDGSYGKAIADELSKCNLKSRIHQVHNVIDISPFLSASDVLVFPSIYEGMGMVLLEAQCSGLPCFASAGPIPKVAKVTNLVTWLPLSAGPEKWASAILNTPTNKNRDGYGQKLIEQGLDYQTVAQKYLSLLTE